MSCINVLQMPPFYRVLGHLGRIESPMNQRRKEGRLVTGNEPIRKPATLCLDQFLKLTSIAESGGQAKVMIQGGNVKVNGEIETRRRRKLVAEDVVEVGGRKWPVKDSVSSDFSQ
jgi:ribosome-associated protein